MMEVEPSKPDNHDTLFFHQQRNPLRHYKRVRKEPEELPQALRYFKYANLNPRIAAYLGKQDPKSILKRAKNQGTKVDGKEGLVSAPTGGVMAGDFANDLSREARSLLPDIDQGIFGEASFDQSRFPFSAENEDPQRYQFEETTFAAPNILRELADVLNRFVSAFKSYSERTTLYDPETGDALLAETISPSVLIPAGVKELLNQSWNDLTSEVMYATRMWQTIPTNNLMKYTSHSAGKMEVIPVVTNAPSKTTGISEKKNISGGVKNIVDLLEEVRSKSRGKKEIDTTDSRILYDFKKKNKAKDSTQFSSATPESLRRHDAEQKESFFLRDSRDSRSRKLLVAERKRYLQKKGLTRLRTELTSDLKRAYNIALKNKELSSKSAQSINLGHDGDIPIGLTTEASKVFRYGGYPTISFNMSSRKALEEGWIVNSQPEPNIGEKNLLEWATNRLRQVIKEKETEEEESKKSGAVKPVSIRYYGDSRKETLLKLYRKGNENEKTSVSLGNLVPGKKSGTVPKIPQLSKLDSGQQEIFTIQLPDGTISVLYPKTGQTAIVASAVPGEAGQLYVHCYNNDSDHTPIASFTPYGKSCCYHKNGDPGLVLTEEGGVIKTETGNVYQKWVWPEDGGKLKEPIEFQLNKEMFARILGKNNVTLSFSSNRESIRIPVGAVPGVITPQPLSKIPSAMLQSGYSSSLRSAVDYAQHFRSPESKQKHKSRQKSKKTGSHHKKSNEIETMRQSLDPPNRFEFDSQADRELHRLENKTRMLVDDWMEHYRVALGISSPSLTRMLDKPKVQLSSRTIHSAKERTLKPAEEVISEKQFQSFRSPSAPPRHLLPGPHSLTVEDKRGKVKKSGRDKKTGESHHVRIEIQPTATLSDSIIAEAHKSEVTESTSRESKLRPSTQMLHRLSRSQNRDYRKVNSANALPSGDSRKSRKVTYALLCDGCPVVTRGKLLVNDKKDSLKLITCKCSKHRIPSISDLELDYFLHRVAPMTQLIVICVINSVQPSATPFGKMLDHIYIEKNKNRTQPCRQAKYDQYRILYYDLSIAKSKTKRSAPLLYTRHNVVPGMVLMYCGGRLVFADHIFNGYGNAKNDFRKQIFQSRRDYTLGHFLPDDFRFSPQSGKSGARAAWGGEVGGAGVKGKGKTASFRANNFDSQTFNSYTGDSPRVMTSSEVMTRSSMSVPSPLLRNYESSREFVQFSLSTQNYFGQFSKSNHHSQIATSRSAIDMSNTLLSPAFGLSGEGPHSALGLNRSVQNREASGFVRMQAVK